MVTITNDVFFAAHCTESLWDRSPIAALLHLQELVDALQAKLPTNQVGVFKGKSTVAYPGAHFLPLLKSKAEVICHGKFM